MWGINFKRDITASDFSSWLRLFGVKNPIFRPWGFSSSLERLDKSFSPNIQMYFTSSWSKNIHHTENDFAQTIKCYSIVMPWRIFSKGERLISCNKDFFADDLFNFQYFVACPQYMFALALSSLAVERRNIWFLSLAANWKIFWKCLGLGMVSQFMIATMALSYPGRRQGN